VPPVESSQDLPSTVDAAVAVALDALDSLAELGEDVDDEWQYIQDLAAAWRGRLEAVADERAGEALTPERGAAIARVAAEAGAIDDPHRAIDWLSTLPQVALLALDERP
jgi:hypothetical protein